MQDIHGIRPPVAVGMDPLWTKMALIALAVLLLGAAAFFLIRKLVDKKKTDGPQDVSTTLSPYDAAINALTLLVKQPLDDLRAYYFELSLILRRYVSFCYAIHGTEMTSFEFIEHIKPLNIDAGVKKKISLFLNRSDQIKYAGRRPEPHQVQTDLSLVRQLIEKIQTDIQRQSAAVEQGDEQVPAGWKNNQGGT
jgi:hypothetical protein